MPCYDPPPSYERSDSHPLAHAFGIPTYRVEAHDGKRWSFGIRVNDNSGLPEFCSLSFAKHFLTRAEAFELRDEAARLCGGTLRVARVAKLQQEASR